MDSARTIYVCLLKEEDDFRTLPPSGRIRYIFKYIRTPDLNLVWRTVQQDLANSDPDRDLIVLNGPAYLTGIAGFFWLSDERRKKFNILTYDVRNKNYHINDTPIPAEMPMEINNDGTPE